MLYFMKARVGIVRSDQWICIIHGRLWWSFMVWISCRFDKGRRRASGRL